MFNIYLAINGGQSLIDKIYDNLKEGEKIKNENPSYDKLLTIIQKYFDLELKTINYLNFYIHSEEMLQKLYNAITIENNIIKIVDKDE